MIMLTIALLILIASVTGQPIWPNYYGEVYYPNGGLIPYSLKTGEKINEKSTNLPSVDQVKTDIIQNIEENLQDDGENYSIDVENVESSRENPKEPSTSPDKATKDLWGKGVTPNKKVALKFVPTQLWSQVRRTNVVQHLPKVLAAENAETLEELLNAPRLREVISHKKIQQVYEEEGYEDAGYDHGGYNNHGTIAEDFTNYDNAQSNSQINDIYTENANTVQISDNNKLNDNPHNEKIWKNHKINTDEKVKFMDNSNEYDILIEKIPLGDKQNMMNDQTKLIKPSSKEIYQSKKLFQLNPETKVIHSANNHVVFPGQISKRHYSNKNHLTGSSEYHPVIPAESYKLLSPLSLNLYNYPKQKLIEKKSSNKIKFPDFRKEENSNYPTNNYYDRGPVQFLSPSNLYPVIIDKEIPGQILQPRNNESDQLPTLLYYLPLQQVSSNTLNDINGEINKPGRTLQTINKKNFVKTKKNVKTDNSWPAKYIEQLTITHYATPLNILNYRPVSKSKQRRIAALAKILNAGTYNDGEHEKLHIRKQRSSRYNNKYPFYHILPRGIVSKNSALKYALNPKLIPKKLGKGMEFYESRDKHLSCEDPDLNDGVVPNNNQDGEWNNKPIPQGQRLTGLGKNIECFKRKYFGKDPLDNPLFREDVVSIPERFNIKNRRVGSNTETSGRRKRRSRRFINEIDKWFFPPLYDYRRNEPKYIKKRDTDNPKYHKILSRSDRNSFNHMEINEEMNTETELPLNHKMEQIKTTLGPPISLLEFKKKLNISEQSQTALVGGYINRYKPTFSSKYMGEPKKNTTTYLEEIDIKPSTLNITTTSASKIKFPTRLHGRKSQLTKDRQNIKLNRSRITTTILPTTTIVTTEIIPTKRMYPPKRRNESKRQFDAFAILKNQRSILSTTESSFISAENNNKESTIRKSPRKLKHVEHRRVTKEEVYKTTYIPQERNHKSKSIGTSTEKIIYTNNASDKYLKTEDTSDNPDDSLLYSVDPTTGQGEWVQHAIPKKSKPKRNSNIRRPNSSFKTLYSYPRINEGTKSDDVTRDLDVFDMAGSEKKFRDSNNQQNMKKPKRNMSKNEAYIMNLMSKVTPTNQYEDESSEKFKASKVDYSSNDSGDYDYHNSAPKDTTEIYSDESESSEYNKPLIEGKNFRKTIKKYAERNTDKKNDNDKRTTTLPTKWILEPDKRKYYFINEK